MITRHNPITTSLSFFQRRKTTGWLSQVLPGCYGLSRDKHQVGLSRDNPGYPGITLFWDKSGYPGITQHILLASRLGGACGRQNLVVPGCHEIS